MKNKNDRSLWIGSLICLLTFAFGLTYYGKIPESMAIHFDSRGNPNGYAMKEFVIFVFPILMTLLHIIVNVSVEKTAVKDQAAKPFVWIGKWIVPIVLIITQPLTILKSVRKDTPINTVITIVVGLIFILCGNYFPKNRINPYVGMKFPWLFHDEEGWRKTHKLSGYLWIIAGFILLISTFVRFPYIMIVTVIISLIALVPIIYSLCIYKKRKANHIN